MNKKLLKFAIMCLSVAFSGCVKQPITTSRIANNSTQEDSVTIQFQGETYSDAGFVTLQINGDTMHFSCVKDSIDQQFYLEFTSINGIVDTSLYSGLVIEGSGWAWIQSGTAYMTDSLRINLNFKGSNITASFLPHVTD